jgi:hypothetical protein
MKEMKKFFAGCSELAFHFGAGTLKLSVINFLTSHEALWAYDER